MKLFPYQEQALTAFLADYQSDNKGSGLLYLATGTGKTVIAAHIAKELGHPMLFLVHRDELAQQAIAKIKACWSDVDVGLVKAKTNELGRTVTVASIQSLSEKRVNALLDANDYKLLIQDECHHSAAPTWERAIKSFSCYHLGLSATPMRSDGVALEHIFKKVLYRYTIIDAIKEQYLSDMRGIKIDLSLNIDGISYKSNDFNSQEAARLFEQKPVLQVMFEKWKEYAANRKTVAFTCDIAHAKAMADYFSINGVSAEWIAGSMSDDERKSTLKRFSLGKTQFLANCMILTEGWDEPSVDCILMARPTSSESLYIQSVGRGIRKYPGKNDCLILDFVAVSSKHKIMQLADLTGIPYPKKDKQDFTGIKRDVEIKSVLEIVSDEKTIDFYRKQNQVFEWIRHEDLLALCMGYNNYLIVRPNIHGYEAVHCFLKGWRYTEQVMYRASVQDLCISIAEDHANVLATRTENLKYHKKDFSSEYNVTPKQKHIIITAGYEVPQTSKQAGTLISRIFFEKFLSSVNEQANADQKKDILRFLFAGKITCSIKQADVDRLKRIEAEKIINFYASGVKYNYAARTR
jgi:superfamily II DNA or RNA helicase